MARLGAPEATLCPLEPAASTLRPRRRSRPLNGSDAAWRSAGYVDGDPARHGLVIDGTLVPGGRDRIEHLPNASFVVCTGRPRNYISQLRIVRDLGLPSERYATIVHPSAAVSASSSVGPESTLLAHVTLTAAVRVGAHVAIMSQVTLTHDDVVGDFAIIASGASLGGGVRVESAAYVGAGAIIGEHRCGGVFWLVGMVAVVTRDISACEVWAGVPARRLRGADIPQDVFGEETR